MKRVEKMVEKEGIRITNTIYGVELMVTNNGWQWTGTTISPRLLDMLQQAIQEFKEEQEDYPESHIG